MSDQKTCRYGHVNTVTDDACSTCGTDAFFDVVTEVVPTARRSLRSLLRADVTGSLGKNAGALMTLVTGIGLAAAALGPWAAATIAATSEGSGSQLVVHGGSLSYVIVGIGILVALIAVASTTLEKSVPLSTTATLFAVGLVFTFVNCFGTVHSADGQYLNELTNAGFGSYLPQGSLQYGAILCVVACLVGFTTSLIFMVDRDTATTVLD